MTFAIQGAQAQVLGPLRCRGAVGASRALAWEALHTKRGRARTSQGTMSAPVQGLMCMSASRRLIALQRWELGVPPESRGIPWGPPWNPAAVASVCVWPLGLTWPHEAPPSWPGIAPDSGNKRPALVLPLTGTSLYCIPGPGSKTGPQPCWSQAVYGSETRTLEPFTAIQEHFSLDRTACRHNHGTLT